MLPLGFDDGETRIAFEAMGLFAKNEDHGLFHFIALVGVDVSVGLGVIEGIGGFAGSA